MDDVVIIGGGIVGASVAYFLSKAGRKVKVIERDPTYKKASFPLSLGGFRRQFFQKENINLGKFALEFISNISSTLKTKNNPSPTASMVPNGYLLLLEVVSLEFLQHIFYPKKVERLKFMKEIQRIKKHLFLYL